MQKNFKDKTKSRKSEYIQGGHAIFDVIYLLNNSKKDNYIEFE